MKGIMITAPSSGSGKTMVTMGILRALRNRRLDVCGFKTGPDYIDTAYLKAASGKDAGNLDMHLQGREGMKQSLSMSSAEYCVIEGAMGYFDGIYNTFENSSCDISGFLGINAILVYTPAREMFSAVPKIKGMADFDGSTIKGVILNQASEKIYHMLKGPIEEYTGLSVLGYLPRMEDIEIESRHLGLIQSAEIDDMEEKLERMAAVIQKNIDLELLVRLMKEMHEVPVRPVGKRRLSVAAAMDKAFSFYYRENRKLLADSCEVEYFSPLRDGSLPGCDFLYIGGGYPEVFRQELSENKSMLSSIRMYADSGGCIYAECGGLMYLTEQIEDCGMVGIFEGTTRLTKSLQRFGYIDMELKADCMLGKQGEKLTAHEFHKSVSDVKDPTLYRIRKTMGDRIWECGYRYKNVLAGYPHINFLGNWNAYLSILDYAERNKRFAHS